MALSWARLKQNEKYVETFHLRSTNLNDLILFSQFFLWFCRKVFKLFNLQVGPALFKLTIHIPAWFEVLWKLHSHLQNANLPVYLKFGNSKEFYMHGITFSD